jgi:hypothetical protein
MIIKWNQEINIRTAKHSFEASYIGICHESEHDIIKRNSLMSFCATHYFLRAYI